MMRKKIYLFLPVVALLVFSGTAILAQKPGKHISPPGAKYKKPLVKSWLGKVTGNININAEEAKLAITLPLQILDDKNVAYSISSYQFAYKRIGVTEDEATGKAIPESDIAADRFTTTPLPAVWQKNILETLHKGEELYFFDIIVFDKQGRRFFAPELKMTIQ